jgi:hypothetical protein
MKKRKLIALLLSLSIFSTTMTPVTTAFAVAGENDNKSGMVINKTAKPNDDGTYTIQLEAYATGDKVITEVTEEVPTDIILVLDQSGSMDEKFTSDAFREYTNRDNSDFYNLRHNGARYPNLYYHIGDGTYAKVFVKYQAVEPIYNKAPEDWENNNYYTNRDKIYALVGGKYLKVNVKEEWYGWKYIYSLPDGTPIEESSGRDKIPNFNHYYILSTDEYIYTYSDMNGDIQTIGTSVGAETRPDFILYQKYNYNETKRDALKTAVTNFSNSVNKKAAGVDGLLETRDDVKHRVAVVGFASENGYRDNTELLSINGKNSGSVGVKYESIQPEHLIQVLQDMSTEPGQTMVQKAINALDAYGATRTDLGMDMANSILNANPIPAGEKRNRVVILFTDGAPTSSSDFNDDVAKDAINNADAIKENGATVYSVGIFNGADATSPGDQDSDNLEEKCNWFMQKVSSNEGEVHDPSYYLSAADSATLNDIFYKISDNIETGGSSTLLSEDTAIKDIISPYFTLADDDADISNITLETYSYTGDKQWKLNDNELLGATATVDTVEECEKVNVTGFDFAKNYVGTVTDTNGNVTYRGNKLVISIKVKPKPGFLGGSNVPTNTSAGVYENNDTQTPILTFEQPRVDVPIKEVTVTAPDKDIYLLNDVTLAQLTEGATAKMGGEVLNLAESDKNYNLEPWQTEYVDITVEIKDKDGYVVVDRLVGLTDDQNYTVSVKVSPKDTTTGQTSEAEGNINVYKPELTFKDSEVFYGDDIPDASKLAENLTTINWKHDGIEANPEKMIGEAPNNKLTVTYTPDTDKVSEGKINTKQDVGVAVTVSIDNKDVSDKTTFLHEACEGGCSWNETTLNGDSAFLLHVKTCQLTITKEGEVDDEPYVFDLYHDDKKYSQVTIVGKGSKTICELPVGTYTIKEDEGWSWRYEASDDEKVILTAEQETGKIICSNTKQKHHWLNGFSQVIKNIYGITN